MGAILPTMMVKATFKNVEKAHKRYSYEKYHHSTGIKKKKKKTLSYPTTVLNIF